MGVLEVAQLLLDYGADPRARSSTGKDSLYMALENGQSGLAQLLLKRSSMAQIQIPKMSMMARLYYTCPPDGTIQRSHRGYWNLT